jgi:quercetin dioxygenase-like cupin family protein
MVKKSRPAKKKIAAKSKVAKKVPLQHAAWDSIELEEVNPLFLRQYVVGTNVMLSRIFLKEGSVVPLHRHRNEQLSYVLEGSLVFSIAGKKVTVNSGEVLLIPPGMPHRVEALKDTLSLDIFDPPRRDWINKTDSYLRGSK